MSSRVREYEELASGGFPDLGFDVVYVIEPWPREGWPPDVTTGDDIRRLLRRIDTRLGIIQRGIPRPQQGEGVMPHAQPRRERATASRYGGH